MPKQEENFAPESVWHTLTPNAAALSMPFCITEAGHFYAMESYLVERRRHESHLLLYTVSGSGRLVTQDAELTLTPGSCAVVDCRSYHKYNTQLAPWNFYWVHFQGVAASAILSVLYPARITAIAVQDTQGFTQLLEGILAQESSGTVADSMELSAQIHGLFNLLAASAVYADTNDGAHNATVAAAVEYIRAHYAEPITVDDMLRALPLSKYYFIRTFRRVMGTTPYSYLTVYRINHAKVLLRSTRQSIEQIAEDCGFRDASNFIAHFKKCIGQTPAAYRRDFGQMP